MDDPRISYLTRHLTGEVSSAAGFLGDHLAEKFIGASILLYGSAGSVLSEADPTEVLFDFYVIAPDYKSAVKSPLSRIANKLIPPNVYYLETDTPFGNLRAKYAVLSIDHFEKLTSHQCFHSYFWARFAQPFRLVTGPDDMRARIVQCAAQSIDTFVARAAPLAPDGDAAAIWAAGLSKSYNAELRAEQPERVAQLLASYGDWPEKVTRIPVEPGSKAGAEFAWRMRAMQGGFLSVLRLLKGTLTFEGGIDYIAWKIGRHNGIKVPVKAWERRWPLIGAPIVAMRYYRLKAAQE